MATTHEQYWGGMRAESAYPEYAEYQREVIVRIPMEVVSAMSLGDGSVYGREYAAVYHAVQTLRDNGEDVSLRLNEGTNRPEVVHGGRPVRVDAIADMMTSSYELCFYLTGQPTSSLSTTTMRIQMPAKATAPEEPTQPIGGTRKVRIRSETPAALGRSDSRLWVGK